MLNKMIVGACLVVAMLGMGCGPKKAPAKNSGKDGAAAAKSSNQKASSKATSNTTKATDKGTDNGGVACDSDYEGFGWCETDTDMIFCSGGTWYQLNCGDVEASSFCGVDDVGALDCWVEVAE